MNTRSVFSDVLPVSGSSAADVELVAPAAELDLLGPAAVVVGRREVRLLAPAVEDGHRRARDRRPAQREHRRVLVDLHHGLGGVGDRQRRRLREPHELDAHVDRERGDQDRQQRGDDDHRRERQALARRGERLGDRQHRLGRHLRVAPLAAPLADDLLGVQPEVERVVAQEALGVDGAGELGVLAVLEGGQVPGPDLGVALGAVQVDALALARRQQALRERGAGLRGVRAIGVARARPSHPVSRRHTSPSRAHAVPDESSASMIGSGPRSYP